MSVTFFPDKNPEILERLICKEDGSPLQGECDVYRSLYNEMSEDNEDWYVWHDLKLPIHSEKFNKYRKTSSQLDFLILYKEGVIILEVKGGVISFKDNLFYYGKNFNKPLYQDPFRQAEGYKYTILNHILDSFKNCCICYAVVFPHVDNSYKNKVIDNNLLWSKYNARQYDNSYINFIKSVFDYNKKNHSRYGRYYSRLKNVEIKSIREVISPLIADKNPYDVNNTLEWLQIKNLEILEGLHYNQRIMIQGPPGSGKTTIAKAFIDSKVGKQGLYICWNKLLMYHMKKILEKRGCNCKVISYIKLIEKINPEVDLQDLLTGDIDQIYKCVKESINVARSKDQLPKYDYLVIDEGQELFDIGIDLIIDSLSGQGNGLTSGNALILYDIDQGYHNTGRSIIDISNLLLEYCAHFYMNINRRSAQHSDIAEFSTILINDPESSVQILNSMDFPNIYSKVFNSLKDIKTHIVQNILSNIRNKNSSLRGQDCVLLIESCLFGDEYKNDFGMKYWLTIKNIEEITKENVIDNSNALRYTSILRYKGLEKKIVFLVITEPNNKNKNELYVGMTRAISRLELLIVKC